MELIDRVEFLGKMADKAGCSVTEYQDALGTAITIINGQDLISSDITIANPTCGHNLTWTTCSSKPPEDKTSFICPCCGTHYIARDPGFVPNCHNCGAIMRKE